MPIKGKRKALTAIELAIKYSYSTRVTLYTSTIYKLSLAPILTLNSYSCKIL